MHYLIGRTAEIEHNRRTRRLEVNCMNLKPALARRLATSAALALVAAVSVGAHPAAAQYGRSWQYGYGRPHSYEDDPDYEYRRNLQYRRETKREPAGQSRNVEGAPLLAVVALGEQRVTIYNAHGKMLQAPVSTGAAGLETPAGIYSVLQKEEFHQSNVYEDGNMPFMERITWTGIALHGGVLPGYPASHGCVRMPEQFAQRLFGLTDIGMRVVVVPHDIAPAEISHPALFKPAPVLRRAWLVGSAPERTATAARESNLSPGFAGQLEMLKEQAAAKSAEADAATKEAEAARRVAARKAADAAKAVNNLRMTEGVKAKAEEALKAAARAVETASSPEGKRSPSVRQAELAKEKAAAKLAKAQTLLEADKEQVEPKDKAEVKIAEARARLETANEKAAAKLAEAQAQLEAAKQKAVARLSDAQAQLEAAKSQVQARADQAAHAEEAAKSAEAAREVAVEASADASRKTLPVSVFISRKTQRLYIRQGYIPVFEGPVTIRDADKPIGTYVFTALGYHNNAEVHWSVVSMYKANRDDEPAAVEQKREGENRSAEAAAADVAGAKAALGRITIPPDMVERFAEVVLPGASLIISDEGASIETGKDTDFVVLMSGEPQGGIKTRRREQPLYRRDYDYFRGGGSFFSFFN
jgi:lipoprotein-anchoring transpeptidase ErfK/SrfK